MFLLFELFVIITGQQGIADVDEILGNPIHLVQIFIGILLIVSIVPVISNLTGCS